MLNTGCTVTAAFTPNVQAAVPESTHVESVHPANVEPAAATGVSVNDVPLVKFALHVLGQVIPAGLLVTVPDPVPDALTVTTNVGLLNVAVTVVFAVSETLHVVPVPLHPPPLQPPNVDPLPGASDIFTTVPFGKLAAHVPVTTPVVLLHVKVEDEVNVTDPVPVPLSTTVSVGFVMLNVAVTDSAALIVTTHDPVPEHPPPLHPANVELESCDPVNVTCVPLLKFAVHALGQEIPAGLLVTVPPPEPASVTVNAKPDALNVAVTDSTAFIVTTQLPVPLQAPLQPANVEPEFAVSVNVTCAPLAKFAEQVLGHKIPEGLLDTVPLPVPASVTVNAKFVVALNVVTTVTSAEPTATVQVVEVTGVQFELNPPKLDPAPAAAVSVTLLLSAKGARQTVGQLIPAGLLVTVPAPLPFCVTITLFVPTVFSPKTARPAANPEGDVNVTSGLPPFAILNL